MKPQKSMMQPLIMSKLLVLVSLTSATAQTDLRHSLTQALEQMVDNAGAEIDRSKLSNGVCFSSHDGGPDSGCVSQADGANIV